MKQDHPSFIGTVVTGESSLPNWLSVPDPEPPALPKESVELRNHQFEVVFPRILEMVCEGYTFTNALRELPYDLPRGVFRQWISKNPQRKSALDEAERTLGACIFDDYVDLTQRLGDELMDVEVYKAKASGFKHILSIYDKKRFSETKQIEFGGSISITEALAQAKARVIKAEVIDITPRLENE